MDKMDMQTPNMADEKLKKLIEIFPNIVTETIDEDGNVVRAIDKDILEQEISSKVVEGREERYQFTWPDKKQSILAANAPISKTLRPCRDESKNFDTTENLYIEGDNLEVLKLLQETYLGKIKMIYIDPPYNTGNDFVYNDDFKKTTDEYLEDSGQFDDEGNRLDKNLESNGRFHTDWLNMIYARLKLARNLLSDDGVIFISIDDNEQANLKKVCEEIFGNGNVDNIIWQKQDPKIDKNTNAKIINRFKSINEFILILYKNKSETIFNKMMRLPDWKNKQKNLDKDPRGNWQSGIVSYEEGHKNEDKNSENYFSVTSPSGIEWRRHWFYTKDEMNKLIKENRIYFGKTPNYSNVPRLKTFESEEKEYYMESILRGVGTSSSAKDYLEQLLGNREYFDTPKPVKLIHEITRVSTFKDSYCLDFFSGSATTAHAVMQLNAEDGGNRKFIMVQLPEETDEKSEAYKAGYKNICEIGKERIRRAGEKILEENKDKENIDKLDVGFRVLKTDSSNMKDVYYSPEDTEQSFLDNLEDNIKEDRTQEDLLFQVMLDLGVPLSSNIEVEQIEDAKVFKVEDRFLVACFDESISDEVVRQIADMKPFYAVFRDMSMKNDSVAVNFEQIFESVSPETIRKVL